MVFVDNVCRVLIDDVGSFPLPKGITKKEFGEVYLKAQEAYAEGKNLVEDAELFEKFYVPVASSLGFKIDSGIDIVNYPQHYDMHKQFLDVIMKHYKEPFLINEKYAVIPEMFVAESEAKKSFENEGRKLQLKVCVTGPIELHTKTEFGYNIYEEVLYNLAKSVNQFLKNSIINSKYIETVVVAIDEPSMGMADFLNVEKDAFITALEKSVEGIKLKVQIHLHSLTAAEIPLQAKGIEILGCEFAASPRNLTLISKKELERYDKFVRGGITRTNIDSIIPEWLEKGIHPKDEQLADTVEVIKGRFQKLKAAFGERLSFVGPDCGLGSWPSQQVAHLLLKRTVEAVKNS